MRATVGRVVHYVSYGTPGGEYQSECRAAIITDVNKRQWPGVVSLAVLNPGGIFFDKSVSYDSEKTGGSWHWCCVRGEEE